MSKRKSQIEQAIDKAAGEIIQLEAFIARLRDQLATKPTRKPRAVTRKVEDVNARERTAQTG